MVRRGVCVCAHDDVRGRVCVGVVSTSSSTATLRGKESPGDILGTDHERQPSTNQLEEFDLYMSKTIQKTTVQAREFNMEKTTTNEDCDKYIA